MATQYEAGTYDVEVIGQGFGESKGGTVYFYLTINPLELIFSAEDRRRVTHAYERTIFMYITENTVSFVVENLRRLGWNGTNWSEIDPQHGGTFSFRGMIVAARCDHEEYNGQWREKWGLAGGGKLEHKSDASTARNLNAMFGRALREATPAAPTKEAPTAAPQAQTTNARTDDVPF